MTLEANFFSLLRALHKIALPCMSRSRSSVMSPTAFDVTEEFSVDGGPFKRLGNGHFTKLP